LVAEVSFDRAGDRRYREAGERRALPRIEPVDRLDQRQRGDLPEVVETGSGPPVLAGDPVGQVEVGPDQLVASRGPGGRVDDGGQRGEVVVAANLAAAAAAVVRAATRATDRRPMIGLRRRLRLVPPRQDHGRHLRDSTYLRFRSPYMPRPVPYPSLHYANVVYGLKA
jgi:hypothetical protein